MSFSHASRSPATPGALLFLGGLAEVLTAGVAIWLTSSIAWSHATGWAQVSALSIVVAAVFGALSIITAAYGARRAAFWLTVLTVAALILFSVFIWFAFFGLPCIAVWLAFARRLRADLRVVHA